MLAWPTLCTASASGTWAGIAARALAVRTCLCGTTRIASSPAGTSKRAARAPTHTTNPPISAAAALSGWPSSLVAAGSSDTSSSKIESAAIRPAT